jgi:hypothetical protein
MKLRIDFQRLSQNIFDTVRLGDDDGIRSPSDEQRATARKDV